MEGNARYAAYRAEFPNLDEDRRRDMRDGQAPRAVVFACSDSRVPVEHIFDVGLGDIFVVRTAGEILDPAVLGSLEFGVGGLGVDLLVVMGHESCGAVKAATAALDENDLPGGWQRTLVEKVAPSILAARARGLEDAASFEKHHVEETVEGILDRIPLVARRLEEGRLGVVGLRYRLKDGRVEPVSLRGVH